MSIRVMTEVWACDLDSSEQSVLLVLADFADDDGGNCYPSLGRVAWRTGFNVRTVRRIVSGLRERGVLVSQGRTTAVADGRYAPIEYRIDLSRVPRKAAYDPRSERESRADRGRIEGGQDVRPAEIEGGSRAGVVSGLVEIEGGSRGDRMSGLDCDSNLRGDGGSVLRADRGRIVVSADPSVVVVATDPDPETAAAAGGRGAGEGADGREPWHELEGEPLDAFWEIVRSVGERMALAPGSADAVLDWVQLCEERSAEEIREAIRECRRRNAKPWPKNLRDALPGAVRRGGNRADYGVPIGTSFEERRERYLGGALGAATRPREEVR